MLFMIFAELVPYLKSLAFSQLPQSQSEYHSNYESLSFSFFDSFHLSHIQCWHSCVYCQHLQFLPHPPFHFIRFITCFKSSDCHFWSDPLPWASSSGTAVLHWISLLSQYQNTVPSQEPFRIQLFQIIIKRFSH